MEKQDVRSGEAINSIEANDCQKTTGDYFPNPTEVMDTMNTSTKQNLNSKELHGFSWPIAKKESACEWQFEDDSLFMGIRQKAMTNRQQQQVKTTPKNPTSERKVKTRATSLTSWRVILTISIDIFMYQIIFWLNIIIFKRSLAIPLILVIPVSIV